MLENNFTELDNDFITLWSKQMICKNWRMILKEDFQNVEKLAELGSVGAQQAYYLILNKGDKSNEVIDKIVDSYDDKNPMHLWAKLYKTCFEEDFFKTAKLVFNQQEFFFDSYPRYVQESIKEFKSFQLFCQTKQAFLQEYEKTKNIIHFERYFSLATKFYTPVTSQEKKFLMKNVSKLQKTLIKNYKENPNSPEIAYALGRHLYYFNSYYYLIPHKKQGKEILSKLAERPYSKTLQEYQLKGKTVTANEKDKAE